MHIVNMESRNSEQVLPKASTLAKLPPPIEVDVSRHFKNAASRPPVLVVLGKPSMVAKVVKS